MQATLTANGAVLSSTQLKQLGNISHIEVVPMTAGEFVVDVVKPVCPGGKMWCSLTWACETACVADLHSTDKTAECGVGTDQEFCSLERTCKATEKLTCPASWGGMELLAN